MKQGIKKWLFFIALFWTLNVFGQGEKIKITQQDYKNSKVEMADKFREDGKIYVVFAVIAVIFSGVITYLVVIDKKTGKLEKMLLEHKED